MLSPPVLLILLAAIVVLVTIIVFVASGDDTSTENISTPDPAPPSAEVHTADSTDTTTNRIGETRDVDNDVYRAWRELTNHIDFPNLDVNTPAEVAAKAHDAGIDPDSVDTLTALFRDVRYGDQDATAEKEQQAMDALRHIEETVPAEDEDTI